MDINLRTVPTFYINMDSAKKRRKDIEELASRKGITDLRRFEGVRAKNKRLGVSTSHMMLLKHIVEENIYPSLVLEDDVAINRWQHIVSVPDNADALYLGMSRYAWKSELVQGKSFAVSNVTKTYHKVHNMLARHAVVHFNPEYDKVVIDAMQQFIDDPKTYIAGDVQISQINPNWNVYALNSPIFYQSDPQTRDATRLNLSNIRAVNIDRRK